MERDEDNWRWRENWCVAIRGRYSGQTAWVRLRHDDLRLYDFFFFLLNPSYLLFKKKKKKKKKMNETDEVLLGKRPR